MFNAKKFVAEKTEELRNGIGSERVLAACSGGVDSTTTTCLVQKAVGRNLLAVFIDDGMRRENEPRWVLGLLERLGIDAKLFERSASFFSALRGLRDAEEKRKKFRETFYTTLGEIAGAEGAKYLAQGTIAADVAETVGGVKSQHNVLEQIGIDPKTFGFELIEPLKDLYKPQVRAVARYLRLPTEVSDRMPFPGPALAIRVVGEVTPEKVAIVRKATAIVEHETRRLKAFQSFAVLLDGKATGIKDGKRVYGDLIAVRIVASKTAMTARAMPVSFRLLQRIAERVTKEIPSVVRCLYDVTDKPPSTIEFE
jgi:GMP synthase (glutamine-hydrolysing)